jgi:glycogen operon protein
MRNPHVLQLIMDSLRYWVLEMHVDGFRFDLAATLARQFHEVDKLSAFFDIIQQDPVISQVKLIAEPWIWATATIRWATFRPCGRSGTASTATSCRDFWRGEPASLAEFASRLPIRDLYAHLTGVRPPRSTPWLLMTACTRGSGVPQLHNEANGENGGDGESHNRSWNCGVKARDEIPQPSLCALQ